MRYPIIAALVALATSVSAQTTIRTNSTTAAVGVIATSTVTQVVATLTTYCPSATTLSINGIVITVTTVSDARVVLLQYICSIYKTVR